MDTGPSPPASGISLKAIILLLVLVVVVAWLIFPYHCDLRFLAREAQCAHNLRQLIGACSTYAETEAVSWPSPLAQQPGAPRGSVADAHAARLVSARAFEILAVVEKLQNQLFICKTCAFPGPILAARSDGGNGDRWGAAPDHAVSYAFDWAAPADPGADRVVMSDRDPANHGGAVMLGFGDSHTMKLKHVPLGHSPGLVTENSDGRPVQSLVPAGGDEEDSIYTTTGDGAPDPLAPGGGSKTRAWVK